MVDFKADYFTILLICLITIIFILNLYKSSLIKSNLPPSPFRLPIIGHLHLVGPIPHQTFHKLSKQYGPIFRFFIGSTPCIIASTPEVAKEIFKTHDNEFLDRPQYTVVDRMSYGYKGFLFARYGSYWRFLKKISVSELLNYKMLDLLYPVRRDEINQFIINLSQKAKDGKNVELETELMKLTSNVISRMFMGKRSTEEDEDITKIVSESAALIGKFNLSDHIWLFKNLDLQGYYKDAIRIHNKFDALMERVLKDHEHARTQEYKVKDLLHVLLDISEDNNMDVKLTRENIKAIIQDILAAGTDTSAISMEWALAELINHPNVMKKAVEEIDQVVGKSRLIQEADIPKLPYLQAIIKESLRLHPSAPMIQRLSTQDCDVGGYHIPANTTTLVNVWSLGRDPTLWESPLEFMPERFVGKDLEVRGQHYHFLPFGSGRRMCPAASLALLTVHTTVGAMIQCFEWKAVKKENQTTLDMDEGIGLTLPRANHLVCVPALRLDPLPLSV